MKTAKRVKNYQALDEWIMLVSCPLCAALSGEPCVSLLTGERQGVRHMDRVRYARRCWTQANKAAPTELDRRSCRMDAPDGPECWCGRPSVVEAGLCRIHKEGHQRSIHLVSP